MENINKIEKNYLEAIQDSVSFLTEHYKKQDRTLSVVSEGVGFNGLYNKKIVIGGATPPPVPSTKRTYSIIYTANVEKNEVQTIIVQGTTEFIDSLYKQCNAMKQIFGFEVIPLQVIVETSGFWEQSLYLSVVNDK